MATTTSPTSTQLLTWEEFERLPAGDGIHRELLKGELQVLPPAKSGHSWIAKRAYRALLTLEELKAGFAFQEAGYKLSDQTQTWIQPDASFLSGNRAKTIGADGYFPGAPDLSVEVISPSESARDVARKTGLMLREGAKAVWIVYPDERTVHVFTPDGKAEIKGMGDNLTAPFVLPAWSIEVRTLFED